MRRARRGSRAGTGKGDEGVGEIDRGVVAADGTATGVDGDERGSDGTRKRGRKQTDERRIYLLSGDAGNQAGLRSERNAGSRERRIGTVALPRQSVLIHGDDAALGRAAGDRGNVEASVKGDDLLVRGVGGEKIRSARGEYSKVSKRADRRGDAIGGPQMPAGIHGNGLGGIFAETSGNGRSKGETRGTQIDLLEPVARCTGDDVVGERLEAYDEPARVKRRIRGIFVAGVSGSVHGFQNRGGRLTGDPWAEHSDASHTEINLLNARGNRLADQI